MLADSRLTPAAVAAIRKLLEPGEDLEDIPTWADRQREVPGTGPWHYVNVQITESRYDPKFCQPVGCVVSKIEDFRRVLLNPRAPRKEKQLALKFLVHYVQDLHQPVHVGDNGDRAASACSSGGSMSAQTCIGGWTARSSTATVEMKQSGRRN